MNNEKREAIEWAVENFNGKWPYENRLLVMSFDFGVDATRSEFEQVAREMGYVNGYKYGVEYPTNGKKPDLPHGISVAIKAGNTSSWIQGVKTGGSGWDAVRSICIVDERYKPKGRAVNEHLNPKGHIKHLDGNWHERGELPPVGERCLAKVDSHHVECTIIAYHQDLVWLLAHDHERTPVRIVSRCKFRPIQSERDKVLANAEHTIESKTGEPANSTHLGILYDAGMLKLPTD